MTSVETAVCPTCSDSPFGRNVTVKEVVLSAGEQVGHGNMSYASRVNQAVLGSVKRQNAGHQLMRAGPVGPGFPADGSSVRCPAIYLSLCRFGTFASGVKTEFGF